MDQLIERNNTSFPKQLYEVLKKIKVDKNDPLRYHQRLCTEYVVKYPHTRGLLLNWKMGAGKSIGSNSIAEALLKAPETKDYRVIIMASKSLHENYIKDIKKFLRLTTDKSEEEMEKHINSHYTFVSMNASNMITQVYRAVKPEGAEQVEKLFTNAVNTAEAVEKLRKMDISGTLDQTIVIVDEAHNLFNSITNGSKNALAFYNLVMHAKRIKLIFLTGTPIVNNPYEIGVGLNMLAGPLTTPDKITGHYLTLFGEDYEDFTSYFVWTSVDEKNSKRTGIRNRSKFMQRAMGLISYYGADDPEQMKLWPKELETTVERVAMSAKQYAAYIAARDREIEETTRDIKFTSKKKPLQKPEGRSSSYRVRSRQFSNFLYPEYASRTYRDKRGIPRYEKFLDKLRDENLVIRGSDGLGKDESKFGLEVWSPKMVRLLINIQKHMNFKFLDNKWITKYEPKGAAKKLKTGSGIIYSQFIDSGVGLIGRVLQTNGFQEIIDVNTAKSGKLDPKSPKYAIISGKVDIEIRTELVKMFNGADNIRGEKLSILLITSTGAEGLDLHNIRHIHIYEPYWHWARIAQIKHRGIRMGSHLELPIKDRDVKPYIYLSDYPDITELKKLSKISEVETDAKEMKKKIEREDTTDVTLYSNALENQITINSFFRAMQEASIDCHIHYGEKASKDRRLNCLMCAPTNRPMFIPNLDKDIRAPNRCDPLTEEKIKAKTIVISINDPSNPDESLEYELAYTLTPKPKLDFHLFAYDPQLDGYVEIFEDHPVYEEARAAILKKHKIRDA